MTQKSRFLAFDLGAESGRAMAADFDGERMALTEMHRFANTPVRLPDGIHWDVLRLWHEIKSGLGRAAGQGSLASLGLDTWGVDFGLLDREGHLLENPYQYRDDRTDGMLAEAFHRLPKEEIFAQTGVQFLQINTLYQLLSLAIHRPAALAQAHTFLTIPDLFNYWLTGRQVCEFTNATTTQCFDPIRGEWAGPLLERLGIPTHLFPEIVQPGAVLGPLSGWLAEESGAGSLPVIAPACHDTGSAVVAVPAANQNFAWISSGTWSIIGAETPHAVVGPEVLAANLTNEGGVNGTYRFSKNVMGLWLVQECRRTWAGEGQDYSYAQLTEMAAEAPALRSIVDPDHEDFLKPGDMPARIRESCRRTGQPVPESRGAVVRCALESLALKYRWVLEKIEAILGYQLDPIHIVGGGSQNQLLNQFTADATGRRVVAGPVEATALGNALMQAIALGHLASLADARAVVRASFAMTDYAPHPSDGWEAGYERLTILLKGMK